MDEMTAVRDLRADAPLPDTARLAGGRWRLMSEIAVQDAAGTRRGGVFRSVVGTGVRRASVVGLTAAAVAAGVLVTASGGGTNGGSGPAHALTVAEVLDAAATRAAAQPAGEPGAHQWLYTRHVDCWAACRTNEDWLRYDGNQGAFLGQPVKGKPVPVLVNDYGPLDKVGGATRTMGPGSRPQETRAHLATLPTEPHALLERLRTDPYFTSFGLHVKGPKRAAWAEDFNNVASLLSLTETSPPPLVSALYRALALIPNVHLLDKPMKDAAGRPGLAVMASVKLGSITSEQNYLILDPKTYAYQGQRVHVEGTPPGTPPKLQAADTTESSALLATAVVDHPGQRLGGPVPPASSIIVRDFSVKPRKG